MKEHIIGIDLALNHRHRASIWDTTAKNFLGKSFLFDRSFEGFENLLKRSVAGEQSDVKLIFVMEPTSLAWLPLSCYLLAKGHQVYLIKPQMVSALRKVFGLSKSDRLDSQTLARVYLLKPDCLHSLYLSNATINALDRFCRQRAKLVKRASAIKTRLWHIFTFANPKALEAFNQDKYSQLGRAFLRNLISPYKIVELGLDGLIAFLNDNCRGNLDPEIPKKLYEASLSTINIYHEYKTQNGLPFDLDILQFEVNLELDVLEMLEQKIKILDDQIKRLYLQVDPDKQLHTITGFSDVLAPIILAVVGDITRFPNVRSFKGFLGFYPKKKQTTNKDRHGLPIVKTSLWLLKQAFYMAAECSRHWDVEMAEFYDRLISRGLHHDQAICAIAAKLAGRVYAIMKRMADPNCSQKDTRYQLRDLDGNLIDKKTAKTIIDKKFPGKYEREKRQKAQQKQAAQINKLKKQIKTKSNHKTQQKLVNVDLLKRTGETQSIKQVLDKIVPKYSELTE